MGYSNLGNVLAFTVDGLCNKDHWKAGLEAFPAKGLRCEIKKLAHVRLSGIALIRFDQRDLQTLETL